MFVIYIRRNCFYLRKRKRMSDMNALVVCICTFRFEEMDKLFDATNPLMQHIVLVKDEQMVRK